jgi:hypothetical protein
MLKTYLKKYYKKFIPYRLNVNIYQTKAEICNFFPLQNARSYSSINFL